MKIKTFIWFILFTFVAFGQDSIQTYVEVKSTKVYDFWKKYPTYNGKGVVIFIFDTGVDQGVEGLKTTPDGEVKVIDVVDFTGQGDYFYQEVKLQSDSIKIKNIVLRGISKLKYRAIEDKYFAGVIEEIKFHNSNSGLKDLNFNQKQDDVFPFIVFKTKDEKGEEVWITFIDFNLNGDVSDDKPLMDYKKNYDIFIFEDVPGPNKLTFSVNIYPEENKINLHFDDGAHGTHCAGIAAGYKIHGFELNGVAPGAKIISCKIGDNSLSGGATVTQSIKKAVDYANKYSKENKIPCVINMSYGIGSVIEGKAELEEYLKKVLLENPYLYFFTSNGNEGPGLSTAGIPAASPFVFSTGAVLPARLGNDNYGTFINRDVILHFSSRGAEVYKPDVVSPGAASSTVPAWMNSDKMWGTSMASPYSAGVAALLLSAALQEFPDIRVPSKVLFDAIRFSAKPMEGYNPLDFGHGYIDALAAYDLLKTFLKNKEHLKYQNYNIVTESFNLESGNSQNVFVRNLNLIEDNYIFNVSITRADNRNNNFSRAYILKTDQPFIKLAQQKVYIRKNQPINLRFSINKELMKKSGLYVAKITAYRDDNTKYPEFSFLASFINPVSLNINNSYSTNIDNISVDPAEHKRYFINVPEGTNLINFNFQNNRNANSNFTFYFIDEDGDAIVTKNFSLNKNGKDNLQVKIEKGGVYEVVVMGSWRSNIKSQINFSCEAFGINIKEDIISKDENKFTLYNNLSKLEELQLTGALAGVLKKNKIIMGNDKKSDKVEYLFKPNLNFYNTQRPCVYKIFKIEMPKKDFNLFTDFAYYLVDDDGNVLLKGGLNYNKEDVKIKFQLPDIEYKNLPNDYEYSAITLSKDDTNKTFKLILQGAYTNDIKPVTLKINEIDELLETYPIYLNDKKELDLKLFDINGKEINFSLNSKKHTNEINLKFLSNLKDNEYFLLSFDIKKYNSKDWNYKIYKNYK
ncbi:MAG TPA: S8 family serine peptidase [Ignavibacteriales bacterium]|nr:S8 family serine peptidase [Ignavibacteriales bacterium]